MTKFLFAFATTVALLVVQVEASTKELSHEEQVQCIGGKGGSSCTKPMGCDPCMKPTGCVVTPVAPRVCNCTPGTKGFGVPPVIRYWNCKDDPATVTCTEASVNVCGNKNSPQNPAPVYDATTDTWSCGNTGGTCTEDAPIVPSVISRYIP